MREARRVLVGVVAALAAAVVLAPVPGSRAGWSDSGSLPGTTLRTGTLDLRVGGRDADPTWHALDAVDLLPGDVVTAQLAVTNAGTTRASYTVGVAGDGALADALDVQLRAASGGGCGAALGGGARTLTAGDGESLCVEVSLPADAPAAVAAAATDLAVTVRATRGGWSDTVPLTGSTVSTVDLVAPEVTCGPSSLGMAEVRWAAVPGATAYRVHHGPSGGLLTTVGPGVLAQVFSGVMGIVSVEAQFGSSTWRSDPSEPLVYSALPGVLGTCA